MDAGALANILRRPAIAGETTAVDRITLSVKLAITVASAHGGRAELARELQSLAGRYPVIRLVQSPGAPARLEAGPMRLPIPASLRDALLAAVRAPELSTLPRAAAAAASAGAGVPAAATQAATAPGSAGVNALAQGAATPAPAGAAAAPVAAGSGAPVNTAAAMPVSPSAVATLASASLRAAAQWPAMLFAVQSMPSRLPPRLDLPLSTPLLEEATDAANAAARLAGAVRASGLFTEAQLARLLAGAGEPRPAEAVVSGEAARVAVELPLAERTAAQLDVLRRDAAAFMLSPWAGQRARLDLGREPIEADATAGAADAARVFFATLQLDLPQLGAVTVRLRLLNATIAASVEAADPGPWQAALPELSAQLGARGLQAAAVVATATRPSGIDAAGA